MRGARTVRAWLQTPWSGPPPALLAPLGLGLRRCGGLSLPPWYPAPPSSPLQDDSGAGPGPPSAGKGGEAGALGAQQEGPDTAHGWLRMKPCLRVWAAGRREDPVQAAGSAAGINLSQPASSLRASVYLSVKWMQGLHPQSGGWNSVNLKGFVHRRHSGGIRRYQFWRRVSRWRECEGMCSVCLGTGVQAVAGARRGRAT